MCYDAAQAASCSLSHIQIFFQHPVLKNPECCVVNPKVITLCIKLLLIAQRLGNVNQANRTEGQETDRRILHYGLTISGMFPFYTYISITINKATCIYGPIKAQFPLLSQKIGLPAHSYGVTFNANEFYGLPKRQRGVRTLKEFAWKFCLCQS